MRSFALTAVLAAVSSTSAQAPYLPSQDLFYSQPENVSSYRPGQVIRSREVDPKLSGFLANGMTVAVDHFYQYLYATTDSLGNPVAAVTSFLVPKNADPTKLLVYQAVHDSANNDCSPSYILQGKSGNAPNTDISFLSAALNRGWYVMTSHYEGLQAQFLAGVQAGYATLDSVRVALSEGLKAGLSPQAKYAMWYYSGGALVSEWAAELQPSYAPELKFEGAALGGLTPNITSVLVTISKGKNAGLAFAGMQGLAKAYPHLTDYSDQHFIPSKRADFQASSGGCVASNSELDAGKDLFSYFDNHDGVLSDAVPTSVLGIHGVPQMPLFIYKAVGDKFSPVKDTDKLVEVLCDKGVKIKYHKNIFGGHMAEAASGSASALSWV